MRTHLLCYATARESQPTRPTEPENSDDDGCLLVCALADMKETICIKLKRKKNDYIISCAYWIALAWCAKATKFCNDVLGRLREQAEIKTMRTVRIAYPRLLLCVG